jgi:sulfate adenylyltransferase subunit 1
VLKKNEIAVCELAVTEPVVIDLFTQAPHAGRIHPHRPHQPQHGGLRRRAGHRRIGRREAASSRRAAACARRSTGRSRSRSCSRRRIERAEDAVSEAEYRLVRAGRHTYLYRPQGGGDAAAVVRHLLDAGLVVLVETDTPQAADVLADSLPEAKRWSALPSDGTSAEAITQAVLQASLLSTVLSPNNWII